MVISLLLMRFYGDTGGGSTLTPLNEETENSQESAGAENGVEVEENTTEEDSKGNVTPTEENTDETPAETPEEDSKITPIEGTE